MPLPLHRHAPDAAGFAVEHGGAGRRPGCGAATAPVTTVVARRQPVRLAASDRLPGLVLEHDAGAIGLAEQRVVVTTPPQASDPPPTTPPGDPDPVVGTGDPGPAAEPTDPSPAAGPTDPGQIPTDLGPLPASPAVVPPKPSLAVAVAAPPASAGTAPSGGPGAQWAPTAGIGERRSAARTPIGSAPHGAPCGRHNDRAGRRPRDLVDTDPPRTPIAGADVVRRVAGRTSRGDAGDDLVSRPHAGARREHATEVVLAGVRGARARTAAVHNYSSANALNRNANTDNLVINRHKFGHPRVVCRLGQSGGRNRMGHRGRFVLQPRRFSEIFVTSVALVTIALTAGCGRRDARPCAITRRRNRRHLTCARSRAPAGSAVAYPQVSPTGHGHARLDCAHHDEQSLHIDYVEPRSIGRTRSEHAGRALDRRPRRACAIGPASFRAGA